MSTKGITPEKCRDLNFFDMSRCILADAMENGQSGKFDPSSLDPKTKEAYDRVVAVGTAYRNLQPRQKNGAFQTNISNAQISQLISDSNTCRVMQDLGTFKINKIFGWDQQMQDAMMKTYCLEGGTKAPDPPKGTPYTPPGDWDPNSVTEKLRREWLAKGGPNISSFTIEANGIRRNYTNITVAALDAVKYNWKQYTFMNVQIKPPPAKAPGMIDHWTDPEKLPQHAVIVTLSGLTGAVVANMLMNVTVTSPVGGSVSLGSPVTSYTPMMVGAGVGAVTGLVTEYYVSKFYDTSKSLLNPLNWF